MRGQTCLRTLLACALLAGCEASPAPPTPVAVVPPPFKAVLIAGDGSLPVFDDAVESVAARLRARKMIGDDVLRISASGAVLAQGVAASATLDHVEQAVGAMRPATGQGCLVFATSHGIKDQGVWLGASEEVLSPAALDAALAQGCGDAPTVVVVSACFSGGFAQAPMARANRIVLTASRIDRASFGCGAGRTYTFYDACLVAALDQGGPWRKLYDVIRTCVANTEIKGNFPGRSQPQAWFGSAVSDLGVP